MSEHDAISTGTAPPSSGAVGPGSDPSATLAATGSWAQSLRFVAFLMTVMALFTAAMTMFKSLLIPLGISAFNTYLLLSLVEYLERKRIRRIYAAAVILLGALAVVALLVFKIAPEIYRQSLALIRLLPAAVNTVLSVWVPLAEKAVVDLGIADPRDVHEWFTVQAVLGRVESQLQAGLYGIWKTGASLIGGVLNTSLIPLMTFFMLKDYDDLARGLKPLIPKDLLRPTTHVLQRINSTLRSVLRGQVTVAAILAVLYVLGLSLVGLQSAVAIGVVAGVCRVIPYLDVIVGGALSMVVLLSDFPGWGQVLGVALVFLAVQTIDGLFITPRVIGERVGLHAGFVIATVIAFADWFGFWGVLLAVPVVAIIKSLLEAAQPYYQASPLYDPAPRD